MLKKKDKRTLLEKEIDRLVTKLSDTSDVDFDEYDVTMRKLERLTEVKTLVGDKKVSKDTLMIVAGNLLGIVLVLGYEKKDIITSKALGFILKTRI